MGLGGSHLKVAGRSEKSAGMYNVLHIVVANRMVERSLSIQTYWTSRDYHISGHGKGGQAAYPNIGNF